MEGKVYAVCSGKTKGQPKREQSCVTLQAGFGVLGDAHAGTEREVSLLAQEDVENLSRETGVDFPPGSFAENISTSGIVLVNLPLGSRLKLGEAEIEIIAIGKDPSLSHSYSYKGHSLLPTRGLFAKIIQGGRVRSGDTIKRASLHDGAIFSLEMDE